MEKMQTKLFGEPPLFSVTEYAAYINEIVSLAPVLVEGEVSNYREVNGRNFCYFDIKDDKSVAKCFQGFWHCRPVELNNGIKVKVHGVPNMQKNGSFVIDVRQILLSGKGALMEAYLKLKQQLEKEGLFDGQYKKRLPLFPRRIGLIAGKNSSAYHDVTTELRERWNGMTIFFAPSKVQGLYAQSEIVRAIQWFNKSIPVDVLIIARGGGSMEDLQAFNTEEVVREIFASKIPVISAIGHEDHWTLSDYVADMRAKTPTKAAQIAVPDRNEISDRLDYFSDRMKSLVDYRIGRHQDRLREFADRLSRLLSHSVSNKIVTLNLLEQKLSMAIGSVIQQRKTKIDEYEKQLQLLNPLNVLKRGYCVAEKDGRRVERVSQLEIGDSLQFTLPDGVFDATVKEIKDTDY